MSYKVLIITLASTILGLSGALTPFALRYMDARAQEEARAAQNLEKVNEQLKEDGKTLTEMTTHYAHIQKQLEKLEQQQVTIPQIKDALRDLLSKTGS